MNETLIKTRYDKRVDEYLYEQYYRFLTNCNRKNIPVANLSLLDFKSKAKECGYVLGMSPVIPDGIEMMTRGQLRFEMNNEIKIPQKKGGYKTYSCAKKYDGYGMSLTLFGWHTFFGNKKVTYKLIQQKLDEGIAIEEIYKIGRGTPKTITIQVNEKKYPITRACKIFGVNYTTIRRILKNNQSANAQMEFDRLRSIQKRSYNFKLSREKYDALKAYAAFEKISIASAIEKLIDTITY